MLPLLLGLILLLGVPLGVSSGTATAASTGFAGEAGGEGDPFQAGRRWRQTPQAGAWIPREVCLVGQGELLWVSRGGATPGVALHAAETGGDDSPALFLDETWTEAIGPIRVAAGDRPDELFALVQLPALDPLRRRTVVAAFDAFEAARAGVFRPIWSHELDRFVNASGRIASSADGEVVAAALFDDARREIVLDVLDPRSGALRSRRSVPAHGLRGFHIAADGRIIVLLATDGLHVFDTGSGPALQRIPVAAATEALAVSGRGKRIVFGDGGVLRRLETSTGSGNDWIELDPIPAGAGELVIRAGLDAEGEILGLAAWNPAAPALASLRFHDASSGSLLAERTLGPVATSGQATGFQNLPTSLVLSHDGERALAGFWGNADEGPEVLLVRTCDGQSLLELDLEGSVESAAMDRLGTRIVVAAREQHANQLSLRGALELYATGERDLALLAPPTSGGTLAVAARKSGALAWAFVLGTRVGGVPVPGVLGGELWLAPRQAFHIFPRAGDPSGRSDLLVPIPLGIEGALFPLAVQAAWWSGSEWRLGRSAAFPELF